jgi:selenocysteine lyase/cysteine desulfurase
VCSYEFTSTAHRFEIGGTANYPGNVALSASLALINQLGRDAIAKHIVDLTDLLIDRLNGIGACLVTPPEREARSGIVTFSLGKGVQRDRDCLRALLDQRILISQRYTAGIGGLRVSVHFFNNQDDVERLIEVVRSVIAA